jgi:hypothetical protein
MPMTCLAGQCGTVSNNNGCGQPLICPDCPAGQTCNSQNECECTVTCASQGWSCGIYLDCMGQAENCGATLEDAGVCVAVGGSGAGAGGPEMPLMNRWGCPTTCTTGLSDGGCYLPGPTPAMCTASSLPKNTFCCPQGVTPQ